MKPSGASGHLCPFPWSLERPSWKKVFSLHRFGLHLQILPYSQDDLVAVEYCVATFEDNVKVLRIGKQGLEIQQPGLLH